MNRGRVTSPNDCPMTKFGFTPVCGLGCGLHFKISLSNICSNDTGICARSTLIRCSTNDNSSHHEFLIPNVRGRLTLKLSKQTRCIVPFFAVNINLKAGILKHNSLHKLCRIFTLGVGIAQDSFLRVNCGLRSFRAPGCLVLNLNFHFGGGCPGMHRWPWEVESCLLGRSAV